MSLPLLVENQMEVHTQGLSKPYCAHYTATAEKDKTSEQTINQSGPVLVIDRARSTFR
jgi:hypothetical protein